MPRRTKILATLGPATDKQGVLEGILKAGVNVVRINFSHGSAEEHLARVKAVRNWAHDNNTYVGVLMDLQGPKIRVAGFKDEKKIELNIGDKFALDGDMDETSGNQDGVGIAYKTLPQEVKTGNVLILDDGKIVLEVTSIEGNKINTVVTQSGILSDKKGINLRGGGLSADALTEKDKKDILTAAKANADYVALSFPVSGDDVRLTKKLLKEAGSDAGVISKIERAESLVDDIIADIIQESAGIMVARGDLGVEIGDPQLPAQQKRLIKLARSNDRIVITATQMLESMISNPIPTRAEVFDVANAVLDGTDAVMLSAETAAGDYPENAVKTMHDVCIEAEKNPIAKTSHHRLYENFTHIDETIAMSTMYAANHLGVKVVAALTESGKTPLWMSRMSSDISIYAMSDSIATLRKTTLYRGVYPCGIEDMSNLDWSKVNARVIKILTEKDIVGNGDLVVLTKGMHKGESGGTNLMKILCVGDTEYE
ncbi:Pyruvate kinase (EC 2.7.1.40) [uncultured Gammaproteobacteria bacterium]|uniref:Pyruvate kinase n=3 Tax=sulfur-oxidizing symbionts TaxID=32036 RepID=A0A1H6KQR8_9GAMM|nr:MULTISPECIES: pyruvate kinase [sulfur-oxidizing symbionts]CAC9498307.1 Pyruvate kinase (EC 2.7.1.40) [uncultured Gammaproteobacteria bacterium]CAB5497867.1 Pyruvate kinase (EC [Bathymodiolus thermophilus thioautotrophic gill symbiont]CAB5499943.1 Pyruvate kinase (EC [Bathymodiolus azoricus thioautotrophic gill symbiont]CAC9506047.1 Pyruvate kinase (EC 2.7.1.40) [uncultured Gammaproteobacteria bacterium]CAC9520286.1 Pyruvate kinase (EC 2.7.1.40) [uncultured Gammaproteobacteria bacterium]